MKTWQLKQSIRSGLHRVGLDVTLCRPGGFPFDFDRFHIDVIERVRPFTMTSPERLFGLIEAAAYLVRAGVKGSIVECGVYKGGSMMAAALTFLRERSSDRELYLYDTFSGMTQPGEVDVDLHGRRPTSTATWAIASEEQVRLAMQSTGYPESRMHFVKGRVEETLPSQAPEQIALLRLDTDWYESTRHELVHLYPRLAPGGVLIVDDYGQYQGARKAVDEYFAGQAAPVLLQRMDFSGRMCVKR